MADFALLKSQKLISRKISVIDRWWKFHPVRKISQIYTFHIHQNPRYKISTWRKIRNMKLSNFKKRKLFRFSQNCKKMQFVNDCLHLDHCTNAWKMSWKLWNVTNQSLSINYFFANAFLSPRAKQVFEPPTISRRRLEVRYC